jgi:hypothetical protein
MKLLEEKCRHIPIANLNFAICYKVMKEKNSSSLVFNIYFQKIGEIEDFKEWKPKYSLEVVLQKAVTSCLEFIFVNDSFLEYLSLEMGLMYQLIGN